MLKSDIKELTEVEFEELLLTIMVGVYVRTAVLDSQGRDWKRIDKQLDFFLRLAEKLGFKSLLQYYNHQRLPKDTLEKREEKIIDDYNEDEFWEKLQVRLGQRDFYNQLTDQQREKLKMSFWLPEEIHKIYEKYEKEFTTHGLERLEIVQKRKKNA